MCPSSSKRISEGGNQIMTIERAISNALKLQEIQKGPPILKYLSAIVKQKRA
jgi:hypothetical protein